MEAFNKAILVAHDQRRLEVSRKSIALTQSVEQLADEQEVAYLSIIESDNDEEAALFG